ncbi:hypothetical protein HW555_008118 [Spodoptera exigua]|uniref:Uncharacterized protein n=1 Tax=Spodoptera exigua TaxID=7107 RepID=A0A835GBD7_SPOEX|nr:hypothetical protein HW555_008118 [Spodoptera exigua]
MNPFECLVDSISTSLLCFHFKTHIPRSFSLAIDSPGLSLASTTCFGANQAILTQPRMVQRSAWMRVLPLLVSISICIENTHSLTHRKCIHARSCGSRDTPGETCTPARSVLNEFHTIFIKTIVMLSTARPMRIEQEPPCVNLQKGNYARECAKNPHDDADIQSRRNARRYVTLDRILDDTEIEQMEVWEE